MVAALGLVLAAFISTAQEAPCKPGTVVEVRHGRDYTLLICGVGVVGLRGVEAPLRSAEVLMPMRGPSELPMIGGPGSAELLGGTNIGPEAVAFLSKLVGQRVTIVSDGYRIGDMGGRLYAYVYLADKTLLNAEMIRLGYGYADRQGSHPRRDEFIALEETARRTKVGVWAK
jgi:nuclease-like protein